MSKIKLKRIFHTYDKWEDYINGMFDDGKREEKIREAINILTNLDYLYSGMKFVAFYWKFAAEYNLTNRGSNRRAWLGQAACNYLGKATEYETRIAWGMLSEQQRDKANGIADIIIKEWEENYLRRLNV